MAGSRLPAAPARSSSPTSRQPPLDPRQRRASQTSGAVCSTPAATPTLTGSAAPTTTPCTRWVVVQNKRQPGTLSHALCLARQRWYHLQGCLLPTLSLPPSKVWTSLPPRGEPGRQTPLKQHTNTARCLNTCFNTTTHPPLPFPVTHTAHRQGLVWQHLGADPQGRGLQAQELQRHRQEPGRVCRRKGVRAHTCGSFLDSSPHTTDSRHHRCCIDSNDTIWPARKLCAQPPAAWLLARARCARVPWPARALTLPLVCLCCRCCYRSWPPLCLHQ